MFQNVVRTRSRCRMTLRTMNIIWKIWFPQVLDFYLIFALEFFFLFTNETNFVLYGGKVVNANALN